MSSCVFWCEIIDLVVFLSCYFKIMKRVTGVSLGHLCK